MDFTLKKYTEVLKTLLKNGYEFVTLKNFQPEFNNKKIVILRHDVDKAPVNSFNTALIEHKLGIAATYYFRIVRQSFDKDIIRNIAALGHEIGYHYEDMALANGDEYRAIQSFEKHLTYFSDLCEVKTIAMHGSPVSRYDNRLLWKRFSYRDYGITKEPYFDIDFTKVLYLTDTGRRWNGKKVSVRDKEMTNGKAPLSSRYNFRSTKEIMNAAEKEALANLVMINTHPQRWTDNPLAWLKELILQGIKNPVKRILVKKNSNLIE